MKKGKEYVYSSTELARYYGLTVKGMEFYERKDLIRPQRIGSGKMRRIDLPNCYRLAAARMLRNCGFSLDESAEMLENNAPGYLADRLADRAGKLSRELELQQGILDSVREKERLIRLVEAGLPGPVLVEAEPAVRLFVRLFHDAHESSEEATREFAYWNSLMPITEASLRFPLEDLCSGSGRMDTEIGMIMPEKDADRFGVTRSERVRSVGGGACVYSVCAFPETVLDEKAPLRECFDFIRERGLRCSSDGYSRLIHVMKDAQGADIRYDEVWIPVA